MMKLAVFSARHYDRAMLDAANAAHSHAITYFDARLGYDPQPAPDFAERYLGLDALLAASHIVSLHCPLTPQTHHLVDAARLARFRPGAILVNSSCGGAVGTIMATILQIVADFEGRRPLANAVSIS